MLMGTQYQRGINGVGSLRPVYGMGSVTRGMGAVLQGFEGNPDNALINIAEGIWNVYGNLGYIMGADPTAMADNGVASRQAVEKYFLSLVTQADVTGGDSSKINSAANTTARHFITMFGTTPRPATGIQAGDIIGACMAYSYGPSTVYAAQVRQSVSWSPATKCAQLKALLNGSGLNFIQVALGGDGLGNMPASSAPSPTATIDPGNGSPVFYDPRTGLPVSGSGGSGGSVNANVPTALPVVQAYAPASALATYELQANQAAQPTQVVQASPAIAVSPSSPAMRMVVNSDPIANFANSTTPSSGISPVGSSTTGGTRTVYKAYGTPTSAVAAPAPSTTDGLTSWVTANPLLAAGLVVGAFMLFGKGK